jgi:C-terminal binding-module, SLH-like, of glucodextranase
MTGGVPDYPPNSVDMQWVNVSVTASPLQFNITFGNLSNVFAGGFGFTQPIIDIYIHEPGSSGSTLGLPGVQINLAAGSAWNWVIQAAGYSGNTYVENSAGVSYPTAALVSTNYVGTDAVEANRTVSIEVPTSLIGSAISTYNYTIVAGFQDGFATNGWDTVNIGPAGPYQGGGATSADAPYVFSYIAPAVVGGSPSETQESLLSTYTTTTFATLVAVPLPLLKVTTSPVSSLGASAIVNASSGYQAFYAVGAQIYTASSTNGVTWTAPTPTVDLPWLPVGFAAAGVSTVGWVAWNGTNYVFQDVTTGTFQNGTASGAIESAALTYAGGAFYLALDVAGTVTIVAPGSSTSLGSDDLAAVAVGMSTGGSGTTYVAYATSTGVAARTLTLSSSAASFGSTVLTASLPTGAVASGIAVAGAPNGAVAVAVAAKNASGSNIYLATGTGSQTLASDAADGTDYSPSLILGSASTYPVYLGFSDVGGTGNLYFIPTPVASLSSTPVTKHPTTSVSIWVYVGIAAVVVVVLLVVALLVMRRRPKQPGPPAPYMYAPSDTGPMAPPSAGGPANPPSEEGNE